MKNKIGRMGLAAGMLMVVQFVHASVKVGDQAPMLKIKSPDGKSHFDLAAYKGKKPVLVNIVNTWCGPCKWETPALVRMYAKYKSQMEFVTVVTPWRKDSPEKAEKFTKLYTVPWMVTFDADGAVTNAYEVEGVPTNCIVGKDGKVVFYMAGGLFESAMEKIFDAVVKGEIPKVEPRPAPEKKAETTKTGTPK